jgi:hypothetical protein
LRESAGSHFDPDLVDLFFDCLEDVQRIRDSFPVETPPPEAEPAPVPLKIAG